jgi:hypothetical protein
VATLHARLGCLVTLLVVCADRAVATWCAEPVVIGDQVLVLRPAVLGPRQVLMVTDVEVARRHPQLTVLSALAHGGRKDPTAVFMALFAALDVVDQDHANLYTDLVFAALPAAARVWLEEFMTTSSFMASASFRYRSEFALRYFNRGEAKALLAILDARSIRVPDDVRAEIMACTDTDQLEEWIRRAATADKIQDVLD